MKLSPLTIPFRALEVIVSLAWIGFIIVIVAGPTLGQLAAAAIASVLVVVILAIGIGYSVAYYRRFEYDLTADTFDVHSGVFARRNREIPYRRIQNVSISKNVIHRLLGIAEVRIETAGGESTELHLRFVADEEASRLQQAVTERKRVQVADEPDTSGTTREEDETAESLFKISSTELALLGVVSFDLRLIVLVVAAAAFLDPGTMAEFLVAVPAIVLAPAAIVVIYLVGAAVSGLVAVTNYYDFTLVRLRDELRYSRGLLRQFSGSIPLNKIQSMTITENVLARRFGYGRLLIETAGYSPGETSGSQTAVPLATRDRVFELARSIEGFDDVSFTRPPKRARERYFFRYLGVVAIIVGIAYAADATGTYANDWYLAAGLAVLAPIGAHLKWVHLGYAVQDDYVITRAGFWNRRIHVVPYHRMQTVFQRQTIFQWRRDLASVRIDTAGSRALVGQDAVAYDIDVDDAARLREHVHDKMQHQLAVRRSGFRWLDGVSSDRPAFRSPEGHT